MSLRPACLHNEFQVSQGYKDDFISKNKQKSQLTLIAQSHTNQHIIYSKTQTDSKALKPDSSRWGKTVKELWPQVVRAEDSEERPTH